MPTPRTQLPDCLGAVFSVSDALSAGVTRQTLRHARFEQPFHGVRRVGSPTHNLEQRFTESPSRNAHQTSAEILRQTIRRKPNRFQSQPSAGEFDALQHHSRLKLLASAQSFIPRLRPGEMFSHSTALILYGCPIRATSKLHVSARTPRNRNRSKGVIGHRHSASYAPVLIQGLPIFPPSAALQQACYELNIIELVVAIDYLLHTAPASLSKKSVDDQDALLNACANFTGRGARKLHRAIAYSRAGAESRMESLTRLALAAYNLDRHFDLQVTLHDASGFIGRFDMVSDEHSLIIEYDGEQHRLDRQQYITDIARLDRARDLGFRIVRVHMEALLRHPHRFAARVARLMGREAQADRNLAPLLMPFSL